MYELIAMALALTLLVILLHRKVKLGRSMVLAAIGLAVLLGVTPSEFQQALVDEWHTKPLSQTTAYLFVMLATLIMMVNIFATAMKETGVSQRLVPALHGLFRSRRLALAAIPMMMGMLPTPAGIMLSAPMVRDLGDHIGVKRDRLSAINFFFRHQWEPVWPLYPAVPLVQGIFGVSAFALISHNMAITVAGLLGGVVFLLLWGIPKRDERSRPEGRFADNIRSFAHAFWPIMLVAALYAGFNLPPAVGLLLAIVVFLAIHKVSPDRWPGIFKSSIVQARSRGWLCRRRRGGVLLRDQHAQLSCDLLSAVHRFVSDRRDNSNRRNHLSVPGPICRHRSRGKDGTRNSRLCRSGLRTSDHAGSPVPDTFGQLLRNATDRDHAQAVGAHLANSSRGRLDGGVLRVGVLQMSLENMKPELVIGVERSNLKCTDSSPACNTRDCHGPSGLLRE